MKLLNKILVVFCILLHFTTKAQISTDSLVLYYPLDGNARDTSSNARHGIDIFTEPTTDIADVEKHALLFDGVNSFIDMPVGLFTESANKAVSLWFKTSVAKGVLMSYQTSPPGTTADVFVPLLYIGTDGKLRGQFGANTISPITTSFTVHNNSWHHVVLSSDAGVQSMYVDGVLIGTFTGSKSLPENIFNYIGYGRATNYPNSGGSEMFFSGSINEVYIYNRPLTETEVHGLYLHINQHPFSQTACSGTPVSFSVTGTGATGISFQWYRDDIMIVGEISSTFLLPNTTKADNGMYKCKVSDSENNSVFSMPAELIISQDVDIKQQPQSIEQCYGSEATLEVIMLDTLETYTFQWYLNNYEVTDAQQNKYTIPILTDLQAGTYKVSITGACGTTFSQEAIVGIATATEASAIYRTFTICSGSEITLSPDIKGGELSFEWYLNGKVIPNSNIVPYTFVVDTTMNGEFSVTAFGACGNASTPVAKIKVNPPTEITQHPSDTSICERRTGIFRGLAKGTGTIAYQWYRNDKPLSNGGRISGATSSELNISNLSTADTALYSLKATGSCGVATSEHASLEVNILLSLIKQPRDTAFCEGSQLNLSVDANGTQPLFQWFLNDTLIEGATDKEYADPMVTATETGNYFAVATNVCGDSLQSFPAKVSLYAPAIVTQQPTDLVLCPGRTAIFRAKAEGHMVQYKWQKNKDILSNVNTDSLVLFNVAKADSGYYRIIANGLCGSDTSTFARLQISETVTLTSKFNDFDVCEGESASFTVSVVGEIKEYQWYKDNMQLFGVNTNTLFFPNLQAADAGNYFCKVQGICATALSDTANITVRQITQLTSQPESVVSCENNPVSFITGAKGEQITFQWFKNTDTIPSQTNDTLLFANITSADTGFYFCNIKGVCGSTTTDTVTLRVKTAPSLTTGSIDPIVSCQNDTIVLKVSVSNNEHQIEWLRNDQSISGAIDTFLLVDGKTAGAFLYRCRVYNSCGEATSAPFPITVIELPKPTISADKNVLSTQSFASYQWYRNDSLQQGATEATYKAPFSGNYHVAVVDPNGCKGKSAPYSHTFVGIGDVLPYHLSVYPVPANNILYIQSPYNTHWQAQVTDLAGRKVLHTNVYNNTIDITDLQQGVYYLYLSDNRYNVTVQFVKQ